MRQALAKQQEAQQAVVELDKKATEERNDAKAKNDRLRARLDAGGRVRVASNCTMNHVSLPAAAGTASMGDRGAVELSEEAGRNVLDIRAGIIADQAALKALQQCVREVCLASD